MIGKLLNPYRYIAGFKALTLGLFAIILTAVVAYISHVHFPDIISVKAGPELPLWYLITQGLSNWIVLSVVLYFSAQIVSKSSVRVIDIFGTQALARTPYVFAAFIGFSDAINNFGAYILWYTLQQGEPVSISTGEFVSAIVLIIVTILLTIWMVSLMYNAYKISANLKGAKAGVSFIIAFIVSTIITSLVSFYLFPGMG